MKKANWKSICADILIMMIGSLCYAIAIDVFTAPNNIAPGGVTGIATMLNYISITYNDSSFAYTYIDNLNRGIGIKQ